MATPSKQMDALIETTYDNYRPILEEKMRQLEDSFAKRLKELLFTTDAHTIAEHRKMYEEDPAADVEWVLA